MSLGHNDVSLERLLIFLNLVIVVFSYCFDHTPEAILYEKNIPIASASRLPYALWLGDKHRKC